MIAITVHWAQCTELWFVEQIDNDSTDAEDRCDSRTERVNPDTDADPSLGGVRDVSTMSGEQRWQLAACLQATGIISCLVIYEDHTTNTDSSVLSRPKVPAVTFIM